MSKPQLYADLPQELLEADEILKRYGRWARGGSGRAQCGSAEGNYRSPQNDEDRCPSAVIMPPADVDRVRAALLGMPTMTRVILQWLYVDSSGLQTKMAKNGIQPRHMRERHRDGVALFWAAWRKSAKNPALAIAQREYVV